MDQNNITAQDLEHQYDALPSKLRDLIFSSQLTTIIQQIGQSNQLHIDQTEALRTIVRLVLSGIISSDTVVEKIQDRLKLTKEQAQAVATDVNELVFEDVRQTMKDFAAGKLTAKTEQEQQEAVAPQEDLGDVLSQRRKELEGVSQVHISKPEPAASQPSPAPATPSPSTDTPATPTPAESAPLQKTEETVQKETPAQTKQQNQQARTPGKTLYEGDDPYREPTI